MIPMQDRITESVRLDGRHFIRWTCRVCGAVNLRPRSGTPWFCCGCNDLNRRVEAEVDALSAAERHREGQA